VTTGIIGYETEKTMRNTAVTARRRMGTNMIIIAIVEKESKEMTPLTLIDIVTTVDIGKQREKVGGPNDEIHTLKLLVRIL